MAKESQKQQTNINQDCTKSTISYAFFGKEQSFDRLDYKNVQLLHESLFGKEVPLLPLSKNLFVSTLHCNSILMGYMLLQWLHPDTVEVLHMGIKLEYQRQEFGKILLLKTIQTLTTLSIATLQLEVAENNIPAMQLYASLGFLSVGRRTSYYRDGADALLLERKL